jgi:predicted transcriptional regulator
MSSRTEILEIIDALLRRGELIETLSTRPIGKQKLVMELGVSRSTVDRSLRELSALGLIEIHEDGHRITLCGQLAREEYKRFENRIRDIYGPQASSETVFEVTTAIGERFELMELLSYAAMDKRDLSDELDISRSTIDRSVRDLELLGLVEYSSSGLQPTQFGESVVEEYRAFERSLASLADAQRVLSVLPPGTDIDFRLLEDAQITSSTKTAPHVPGTRMLEMIRGADRSWMLARAHADRKSTDQFHEEIVHGGMEAEIVFQAEMFEHLIQEYPKRLREMMECSHCKLFIAKEIPFGLFMFEANDKIYICVLVYTSENSVKGLIANDSDGAIEWGERTFQHYRKDAEPV